MPERAPVAAAPQQLHPPPQQQPQQHAHQRRQQRGHPRRALPAPLWLRQFDAGLLLAHAGVLRAPDAFTTSIAAVAVAACAFVMLGGGSGAYALGSRGYVVGLPLVAPCVLHLALSTAGLGDMFAMRDAVCAHQFFADTKFTRLVVVPFCYSLAMVCVSSAASRGAAPDAREPVLLHLILSHVVSTAVLAAAASICSCYDGRTLAVNYSMLFVALAAPPLLAWAASKRVTRRPKQSGAKLETGAAAQPTEARLPEPTPAPVAACAAAAKGATAKATDATFAPSGGSTPSDETALECGPAPPSGAPSSCLPASSSGTASSCRLPPFGEAAPCDEPACSDQQVVGSEQSSDAALGSSMLMTASSPLPPCLLERLSPESLGEDAGVGRGFAGGAASTSAAAAGVPVYLSRRRHATADFVVKIQEAHLQQAPDQSTFEARVRMAERIHAQFSRLMGGHHASAPVLTALRLAYGCVVVHGSMVLPTPCAPVDGSAAADGGDDGAAALRRQLVLAVLTTMRENGLLPAASLGTTLTAGLQLGGAPPLSFTVRVAPGCGFEVVDVEPAMVARGSETEGMAGSGSGRAATAGGLADEGVAGDTQRSAARASETDGAAGGAASGAASGNTGGAASSAARGTASGSGNAGGKAGGAASGSGNTRGTASSAASGGGKTGGVAGGAESNAALLLSVRTPVAVVPVRGTRVRLQAAVALRAAEIGSGAQLLVSFSPARGAAPSAPLLRAGLAELEAAALAGRRPPGLLELDVDLGRSPEHGTLLVQIQRGPTLLGAVALPLLPADAAGAVQDLQRRGIDTDTVHEVVRDLGVLMCDTLPSSLCDGSVKRGIAEDLAQWAHAAGGMPALCQLAADVCARVDTRQPAADALGAGASATAAQRCASAAVLLVRLAFPLMFNMRYVIYGYHGWVQTRSALWVSSSTCPLLLYMWIWLAGVLARQRRLSARRADSLTLLLRVVMRCLQYMTLLQAGLGHLSVPAALNQSLTPSMLLLWMNVENYFYAPRGLPLALHAAAVAIDVPLGVLGAHVHCQLDRLGMGAVTALLALTLGGQLTAQRWWRRSVYGAKAKHE